MRAIEKFRSHLILLDILRPNGDGRDLSKKLKGTKSKADIAVIIFLSHPYIYDTVDMVKTNYEITKPFKTQLFESDQKHLFKTYSSSDLT